MLNSFLMSALALLIAAEVSGQFEMSSLNVMAGGGRGSRLLSTTVAAVAADTLPPVPSAPPMPAGGGGIVVGGDAAKGQPTLTSATKGAPVSQPSDAFSTAPAAVETTNRPRQVTAESLVATTVASVADSHAHKSSIDAHTAPHDSQRHNDEIVDEDLFSDASSLNPVSSNPVQQNDGLLPMQPGVQGRTDTLDDLIAAESGLELGGAASANGLLYTGRSSWDRIREVRRRSMNMTRVEHIEAECQDDFMRIIVHFNGSFSGLIYSAGYAYDPGCVYINGTGRSVYEFLIQLNRCGTLGGNNQRDVETRGRDIPAKNFMWNTVSIQYNSMIEEEWDEHFKVTCEYGYDIWKTVTFPFLDVETQTGNPVVFTLSPPECYMEIRYGYGTTGNRITGPVRVGDPLTLLIYMRSQYDGFDIVVSDCYAHNGADKKITLVDHYGCPVDEKLISPFQGTWSDNGVFETQVYAYMKTFRFTGSPALYIECDVRMCHGACPTQPCHWRRGKRSVDAHELPVNSSRGDIVDSDAASQVERLPTQSVALFQALQVLNEDEETNAAGDDTNMDGSSGAAGQRIDGERVCLKAGVLMSAVAATAAVLLLSACTCSLLCLRMRRQKRVDKQVDAGEPFRPPRLVPRTARLP